MQLLHAPVPTQRLRLDQNQDRNTVGAASEIHCLSCQNLRSTENPGEKALYPQMKDEFEEPVS